MYTNKSYCEMIKELIKVSCSFKNTSPHQRQVVLHLESIKFLTCCEQLVTKTEKAGLFMRVPQPYCALISLSLVRSLSGVTLPQTHLYSDLEQE